MVVLDIGWSGRENRRKVNFIRGWDKSRDKIEKTDWSHLWIPKEVSQVVASLTHRDKPQRQAISLNNRPC